jgi:hypothetical protein
MIDISLTDFVDFVSKSGSAKLTKVKQVKERDDYHPATDFYKILREKLIDFHVKNLEKKELDQIVKNLADDKKKGNYSEAIKGYKKFLGKKEAKWFNPPSHTWKTGELNIKVNPELGLEFNSTKYVIKLYLKAEKLSRDKVTQILCLLEKQLRNKVGEDVIFCLLDVKNAKLHVNDTKTSALNPLLEGEAKSFEIIWNNL